MIDNFRLRTRVYVILPYYLHVQVLHFENRKCVFTQLSWNLNIQTSVVGDHALKKMQTKRVIYSYILKCPCMGFLLSRLITRAMNRLQRNVPHGLNTLNIKCQVSKISDHLFKSIRYLFEHCDMKCDNQFGVIWNARRLFSHVTIGPFN